MSRLAMPAAERSGHPVLATFGQGGLRVSDALRIVSLVPSLTELVCELGLSDRLVGRTSFCVHPAPALAAVPRIGGTKTPKLDRIIELEPTHLIVNVDENRRADVEWLAARVPCVLATHPIEIEDHFELFERFGQIFDRADRASALSADLARGLERVSAKRYHRLAVAYYIWRDPWMSIGFDTFIARMLAAVGLFPVVTGAPDAAVRYPKLEPVELARHSVDAVLLSSEPCRFGASDRLTLRSGLRAGPGGDGSRVPILGIDGEMCSWYGSRVMLGLRYLEAFRERLERRLACRHRTGGAHGAA
jgi:ABC-type hemin transport system substrate-binding protein